MDWETFYDRYQDWADSTLISRISSLKSIGSSDEIVEVACSCLCFDAAYKLIVKAVKLGAELAHGARRMRLRACRAYSQ